MAKEIYMYTSNFFLQFLLIFPSQCIKAMDISDGCNLSSLPKTGLMEPVWNLWTAKNNFHCICRSDTGNRDKIWFFLLYSSNIYHLLKLDRI